METPPLSQTIQTGSAYSLSQAINFAIEIAKGFEERAATVPSQYDLRLLALGPTDVYLQDKLLIPSDWTFAKPKELLFYLASNSSKTKDQIGLVFWPDASPSQLRASLRATLYHLDAHWVSGNGYSTKTANIDLTAR
ncbi:MAG: hypothetical protein HC806_10580 [Anaerolineae bacterium]|nr:hypothetical protein [Anaerolineae bacterium]